MLLNFSKIDFSKRLFIGLGLLFSFILLFQLTNNLTILPTTCPFRLLTGLPCPGCGLTRSIGYLTEGNYQLSLAYNPFGIIFFTYILSVILFPKYLSNFFKNTNEFLNNKNTIIKALIFLIPILMLWFWNITRWNN